MLADCFGLIIVFTWFLFLNQKLKRMRRRHAEILKEIKAHTEDIKKMAKTVKRLRESHGG